ncbi:DUF4430 domain-containing protein [Oceanobacillus saliphilus]|uniref:DUF4430 domain-containing protein n=1 Tax=Oceanobacillus saliphilus TaxID=2925834 RepID=UPI00201DD3F1|nr:DUF4430 domain-containing protein [Oceanobacillus saliphilus]
MKQLFRLAIIVYALFFLGACGQGQTTESQVNQFSDAGLSTTSMETKDLVEIRSNEEEREVREDSDEKATTEENTVDSTQKETTQENNEDKMEETAVSDSSQDNQSDTNANRNTSKENQTTSTSSNSNQSSSNKSDNQGATTNQSSSSDTATSSDNKDSDTSNQTTKPKQRSKPTEKENPPAPTPKNTVTVSVESPSDLSGPNFAPTEVEITDGETAFSATLRVLDSKGISIDYTGSGATAYVKSIGGLGEFDEGPLSGWNIYVDGVLIPRSADAYEVFHGQSIHWKYTKNYLEN